MVNEKEIPSNSLDVWYKDLLRDILKNGTSKGDRTGTGTKSVFGRMFRHKMSEGFPLLTSKKMYTKGVIVELLWFLGTHMDSIYYKGYGRTNIKYLVDNDCMIWIGDAYKKYTQYASANSAEPNPWMRVNPDSSLSMFTKEEFITKIKEPSSMDQFGNTTLNIFAAKWGDLGPIYGKQWCSWGEDRYLDVANEIVSEAQENGDELQPGCEILRNVGGINQITQLINDLKKNPDSRRLMVTAWNPTDVPNSVLPPCHYGFQCYVRELTKEERLSLIPEGRVLHDGLQRVDLNYVEFDNDEAFHELLDANHIKRRELSLSWNQRSVDTPLGLPFNIASYAFLLEILARLTNMIPGELIGYLGDTHIYNNQIEFIEEQLGNPTFPLPKLEFENAWNAWDINQFRVEHFKLVNYQSAGKVNYPLSN